LSIRSRSLWICSVIRVTVTFTDSFVPRVTSTIVESWVSGATAASVNSSSRPGAALPVRPAPGVPDELDQPPLDGLGQDVPPPASLDVPFSPRRLFELLGH